MNTNQDAPVNLVLAPVDDGNSAGNQNFSQETDGTEITMEMFDDDQSSSVLQNTTQSTTLPSNSRQFLGNKRQKTSEVWQHFEHTVENGTPYATCKICSSKYKNPQGTSTLKKHLKSTHGLFEEINVGRVQSTITSDGTLLHNRPLSEVKNKSITNAIVTWVIDSMQSYSSVENPRFQQMLQMCESRYVVPSRTTVSRRVLERLEDLKT
jgi:BED zinc finger